MREFVTGAWLGVILALGAVALCDLLEDYERRLRELEKDEDDNGE